jgi:hypothetical protein
VTRLATIDKQVSCSDIFEQNSLPTLKILDVPILVMDSENGGGSASEQIPTEYTEEQTLRAVRKQNQISGERKEKTINDFPKAAALGRILKDIEFPADKQTIVTFLQNLNYPQSREILPQIIEKLDEKMYYKNVSDVARAARLVE